MLKIIEGGFLSGAHEKLSDDILNRVKEKKHTLLIVPEQQTVISEAEMTDLLPGYAPLYFEVTNFTRLANSIFRNLGGVAKSYCNKSHKTLIMWKALTELSGTISFTGGKREVSAGTVKSALSAISDMKSLGITAEELAMAEDRIGEEQKQLKAKLSDLSKIMMLYKMLLKEKYDDADDDIDAAIEKLEANRDFLIDTSIYIESFTSFTEAQYKLITVLAKRCEVTVHLTLPKSRQEAFEFTSAKETQDRLSRISAEHGIERKLIKLDGRYSKSEFLPECCSLLWRTEGKVDISLMRSPDELRIYEAKTPYEECDFIAADIRRLVAAGARYRDFAVIARKAEDYHGIIDASLSDADIPYFISKKRDAATFEVVKLIYTALSAINSGLKREDVISYAKCLPSGITRDACDEFELYCETWQISGKRFSEEAEWKMNPDGYTVKRTEAQDSALLSVNTTKKIIIPPLTKLSREISKAKTVRDFATALVSFMKDIGIENSIKERTERLYLIGEREAAEENEALLRIIPTSLDVLVEALGDSEIDRDSFLSLLKVVFSEAEIARIPSVYDSVTVGSADMLRLREKKYVYMMGINRGEFPMAQSEASYFTDKERLTLESEGLRIKPETEARSAQELYFFSRAFSYATEGVTLMYTLSNAQFAAAKRADVIDRIIEMTEGKIEVKKISEIPAEDLIYSPALALMMLGSLHGDAYTVTKDALSKEGYTDKIKVAEGKIENSGYTLSEDARALLYKRDLALTQSRIDSYNACPLSYFCRYNISLSEEEVAEFDARSIGSLIHAILEHFFLFIRDEKIDISSITEELKSKLVKKSAKKYLDLLDKSVNMHSGREELLLDRLCRAVMPVVDGLCDEFSGSRYIPAFFELEISKDRDDLPTPAVFKDKSGGEIFVYGSIDRVDTFKSESGELYIRVVDYKTGQKVFSPGDIDEGKNLQMFLYLKSVADTKNEKFLTSLGVEKGKHPIPAGVIYVKTEIGDVRVDKPSATEARNEIMKAQSRLGMLLDDAESLAAMNMKYIPVKFKNDGTPDKRSLDKLYTKEGWDALCERLSNTVTSIADRMKKGEIPAVSVIDEAKETPCEYCKFKPFCRNVKI